MRHTLVTNNIMNHSVFLLVLVVITLSLQHSAMAFAVNLPDNMIQVNKSIDLLTSNRQIHAVSINGRTWDVDPFMDWEHMANILEPFFEELFPSVQHANVIRDFHSWLGSSWVQYREGMSIPKHLYNVVTDLANLVELGSQSPVRTETYYSKMTNSGTTGICPAAEAICDRGGDRDQVIVQCNQCVIACGNEHAKATTKADFMSNGYAMVRCARSAAYRI